MFGHHRNYLRILLQKPQLCSAALTFIKMDNKKEMQFSSTTTENTELPQLKAREEENILQFLNTCTMKDLKNASVFTKEEMTNILKHRANKGTFSSLSSVSALVDVDMNSLWPLYAELLSISKAKTNAASIKKHFTPTFFLEDIKKYSSVTSLEVCLDSVCFANLTSDLKLTSWNHRSYRHFKYKQQRPTEIFELAHDLVEHIPKSDIYLVEQHDMKSKNVSNYVLQHLFIRQLKMSLLHLLNEDFKSSGRHKVFFVRPYFVKKTFDLIVGGEGVSGQHLLTSLERSELLTGLDISSQQRQHFLDLDDSDLHRERYTQALLLSLGFFKLRD